MDILRAVLSINPKAELDVYEENIKTINWRGGTEPIPEADILAERDRLQAEYDALAWKRSRQENYPTIAELTVALYDTDDKADIEAKRAAVKKKYPKP